MSYLAIRHLHVTLVVLSGFGFLLRALWMVQGRLPLMGRWVRVVPHVVDTLLLASGVTLAVLAGWSPVAQPWLGAKLLALVAYIVLGAFALRRARTPDGRLACLAGAILAYAYMVGAALFKTPWSFLG